MPWVDELAIRMVTTEGFDAVYWETLQELGTSQAETFDILNELFEKYFGHKRYSNFESYRVSRDRRMKRENETPLHTDD